MPAKRHNEGKPKLSYALTFPDALDALAKVCEHGEAKYDRFNYLASGKPISEYVDCLLRHTKKFYAGTDMDEDSGLPHVGFIVWNALALAQFVLDGTGIDDRPKRNPEIALLDSLDKSIKTYLENPKATHYEAFNELGVRPFERLVPRYVEEPALEPDKPDVEWELDPDPLAQPNEVLVRLYDLGRFRMTFEDFKNRESSNIWDTRESARLAVHSLIERGWARRVP